MLVVVLVIVMGRAGIQIVFGGGGQAQHNFSVDGRVAGFDHLDGGAQLGPQLARRCAQNFGCHLVCLVDDHEIGAIDLILEHFFQRAVVIQCFVGFALGLNGDRVGREKAGSDGGAIYDGDDTVHRQACTDFRPSESAYQRFREG